MKLFLIFFSFIIFTPTFSQSIYYQETCKCGVTGAGLSTSLGAGSGSFEIYIEPGSTIKKAFLFANKFGDSNDTSILLNNIPFYFNASTQISNEFNLIGTADANNISVHKIDVTSFINPSVTNYSVSIPLQMNCSGCSYNCIYLYVIYENASFISNITSYILINNNNEGYYTDYNFSNFNAITNTDPIGFAIYSDRMNNYSISNDGSYLYFNNGSINAGLLKGSDSVNSNWSGAGVKGHFYYQNNTLFGLDDDTPDELVGGSDGLLKINNYINNNSLNWSLEWEQNVNNGKYNLYSGFFITHSTPCDTFSVSVPNDTIVCKGSQLQLNVSGGQNYEWYPSTGLSCTNCPNPIFTADSTMNYTVRIWNNDSCSVVRPIKIIVNPLPTFNNLTITPTN
ncbi:MAG: hypothetical protein HYR91_11015, partial [Flavobacteriia bacterium]|nr:hypothetical protein [Flavobacteriia bacterium]